jgi:hypothetical protein
VPDLQTSEKTSVRHMSRLEEIPRDRMSGPLRRSAVKKNVAAIHVSGKLTLLQRKLSNVLLLNAYDDLLAKPSHRIDARTLCLMIGYNSNDMDTLKGALRSLAETVAEWDMLDARGRQEWGVSELLSYAKLKEGVCEYAYSPALAEKLHDPKVFALINLNIQRRFTSGHALALYENCYRFLRTGSTGWWEIDLFRKLMGVDDSAYYETFKHLNAKIIKPAVDEINRSSNIMVTPEFRRQGRAVSGIRFRIRENPQLAMFEIDDGEALRASATYRRLVAVGVGDRLARQWIGEHGDDYVAGKLAYVEGQGGVTSPVRYLSAAIRDNFGHQEGSSARRAPGASTAGSVAKRDDAAELARVARLAEAAESDGHARERRLRATKLARVREVAQARTPTQRDADRKLFAGSVRDPLEAEHFAENGWNSALNARAVLAFWEEMVPGIFDDLAE